MAHNDLNLELIQNYSEIQSSRLLWEDIYNNSLASPYLSFDWFSTVLKYFNNDRRVVIAVLKDKKVPIAIMPLELAEEKIGPMKMTILKFAFDGWTDRNGAIVRLGINEIWAIYEIVNILFMRFTKIMYSRLYGIHKSLFSEEHKNQRNSFLLKDFVDIGLTVVIDIPKKIEDFKKHLSLSHRKNIARRTNALVRKGSLKAYRTELWKDIDKSKLRKLMDDAISVCKNSWQHNSSSGWAISDSKTGGFFYEVSEKLAEKGMLDLSVLYLDEKPISFLWGAVRGKCTTINKLGFDKSFSEFSPGMVHLYKHIEDSICQGLKEIDFGHEFFEYKSKWSKHYDPLISVYLYPRRIGPMFIRWLRLFKQRMRQKVKKSMQYSNT